MKRTSAARCGSVPSSRERLMTSVREGPGAPSAPNATLWNSRAGTRAPRAGLEVDVEHFGAHLAGRRNQRGEQRRALARHDVVELQAARGELREIVVEPVGERRIEIDDAAVALRREEARRRMVEIVDGVLQFLEDVLMPLKLARHVGERPDRHARFALAFAERAHAHTQPASGLAAVRADPHLLLQAAAFARRLEQPIDRFRHPRIADEGTLDRPHVLGDRWRRSGRDRRHWRR